MSPEDIPYTSFIRPFIVSALTLVLFAKPLFDLLGVWRVDADYSHGYFVIPIAMYMVWRKKEIWKHLSDEPSWLAFGAFLISLIVYIVSLTIKFHTLLYVAMISIIISMCVSFFGWKKAKYFIGPTLFLLFMFPIPASLYIMITNPLKLIITDFSAAIIRLCGIPVLQEGNLLFFANTRLEVAEACSGIRSAYSYLMLGFIFSLFCGNLLAKIVLIVCAIPLAISVNILRVTITGILSHYFGEEAAQGFFHEFAGMALFAVGLVLMFLSYYVVEGWTVKKHQ
jgi:exosortase